MTDLVKRLRKRSMTHGSLFEEAADALEQKDQRIEELQEMLFDLRGVKTQLGAARYRNAQLKSRIEELKARLEWREDGHDGIYCRDLTIQLPEEDRDELQRKHEALVEKLNRLVARWSEGGDFDLPSHYVRGKTDGCHQCANELSAALLEEDDNE